MPCTHGQGSELEESVLQDLSQTLGSEEERTGP